MHFQDAGLEPMLYRVCLVSVCIAVTLMGRVLESRIESYNVRSRSRRLLCCSDVNKGWHSEVIQLPFDRCTGYSTGLDRRFYGETVTLISTREIQDSERTSTQSKQFVRNDDTN